MANNKEFTTAEGFAYLLGAVGVQISTVMVMQWALFFYSPPEGSTGKIMFTSLAMATAMMWLGRIFDAVSDPIIGYWSDKTRSKLGRRRPFIIYGSIPMTIVFILFWLPPVPEYSWINFLWGTFFATAYFWMITVVLVPFIALAPEIAITTQGRVKIGMYAAIGMIIGFVLGNFSGQLIESLGIKATAIIIGLAALVCFQVAGWVVKERFDEEQSETASSIVEVFQQMVETLNNRPFLVFVVAETIFTLGFSVIQLVLPDFNKVILQKEEGFVTLLLIPFLAVCLPLIFVVGPMIKKWNKKNTYAMGMLGFAVLFPFFAVIGSLPDMDVMIPIIKVSLDIKIVSLLILVGLAGAPQAIKYVTPSAMIGEIADYGEQLVGHRREAIYAGAIGFGTKTAMSLGILIRFIVYQTCGGFSVENPRAVILMGPVTAVICVFGFLIFLMKYPVLHVVKGEEET